MTYPAMSDWNSGTPGSAWYIRRVAIQDLEDTVCGSTGWALLAAIQEAVRNRLTGTGTIASYQGTIGAADIPATGFDGGSGAPAGPGWDEALLRGIYALARRDALGSRPADAAYLAAVETDGRAARTGAQRPIAAGTLATALWVAFYNAGRQTSDAGEEDLYGLGSPSEIVLDPGGRLPLLNVRPPVPPTGYADASVCAPVSQARTTLPSLGWFLLAAAGIAGAVYVVRRGEPRGTRRSRRR